MAPKSYRFLVASYTDAIHILEFDPSKAADKALTHVSSTIVGYRPSWIERHPTVSTIYFTGLEQADGRLITLKYSPESESLEATGDISSDGSHPCHILALENQVIVGNYSSSTLGIFDMDKSSSNVRLVQAQPPLQFSGSGPVESRQERSHPHQVYGVKDQTKEASPIEILVPDLGSDKIIQLSKGSGGKWEKKSEISLDVKNLGGGPRHVVVHNRKLYVLLELSSKIAVYSYDSTSPISSSTLLAESKLPMPEGLEAVTMLAAELLIPRTNDRFPQVLLYASNRDDPRPHGDIISIYAEHRDGQTELELVGQVFTGLNHVRAFSFFGPDDRYMIAGGADGGGVKVFERENRGLEMREIAHLPTPDGDAGLAPTGFLCT